MCIENTCIRKYFFSSIIYSVNCFHIMCIQINPIMYAVYIVIIQLFMDTVIG